MANVINFLPSHFLFVKTTNFEENSIYGAGWMESWRKNFVELAASEYIKLFLHIRLRGEGEGSVDKWREFDEKNLEQWMIATVTADRKLLEVN